MTSSVAFWRESCCRLLLRRRWRRRWRRWRPPRRRLGGRQAQTTLQATAAAAVAEAVAAAVSIVLEKAARLAKTCHREVPRQMQTLVSRRARMRARAARTRMGRARVMAVVRPTTRTICRRRRPHRLRAGRWRPRLPAWPPCGSAAPTRQKSSPRSARRPEGGGAGGHGNGRSGTRQSKPTWRRPADPRRRSRSWRRTCAWPPPESTSATPCIPRCPRYDTALSAMCQVRRSG